MLQNCYQNLLSSDIKLVTKSAKSLEFEKRDDLCSTLIGLSVNTIAENILAFASTETAIRVTAKQMLCLNSGYI